MIITKWLNWKYSLISYDIFLFEEIAYDIFEEISLECELRKSYKLVYKLLDAKLGYVIITSKYLMPKKFLPINKPQMKPT